MEMVEDWEGGWKKKKRLGRRIIERIKWRMWKWGWKSIGNIERKGEEECGREMGGRLKDKIGIGENWEKRGERIDEKGFR